MCKDFVCDFRQVCFSKDCSDCSDRYTCSACAYSDSCVMSPIKNLNIKEEKKEGR